MSIVLAFSYILSHQFITGIAFIPGNALVSGALYVDMTIYWFCNLRTAVYHCEKVATEQRLIQMKIVFVKPEICSALVKHTF